MENTFLEICQRIKSMKLEDTGFKNGIKTTSYEYTVNGMTLKSWQGDAETSKTLLLDNEKVGTWYECWGKEKFECNEELLNKIKKRLK